MQDGCRIFGNGKSSKTIKKNQHHKFPSGLGYPMPEGKDEGEILHTFSDIYLAEENCLDRTQVLPIFVNGAGKVAG